MNDHVKYLPPAAIPASGAAPWAVPDARRWLEAGAPRLFAPVTGGWLLAPVVLAAVVLIGWNEPEVTGRGTEWAGYPEAVLLATLPLWFRYLPAATLVSSALLASATVLTLFRADASDDLAQAGSCLVLGACAWAFTGALFRLRSRRRQRDVALAAAGAIRGPLPRSLPKAHHRRGLRATLAGSVLCLAAAALLLWGLVQDVKGHGPAAPYDAIGQQGIALLLLVPGTPLLGRGVAAGLAARRLHRGPQPVLRVGVRAAYGGTGWLYPDARTTDAPALIAYRDRYGDTERRTGMLLGGSEERLRSAHHDVDAYREPFEALLYGVPFEGAEVVLSFAVYHGETTIGSDVTAAQLLPLRRRSPGSWSPRATSYRLEERERSARRREEQRSSGSSGSSGCGSSGSCGSSCSSSCGGGCGGGD